MNWNQTCDRLHSVYFYAPTELKATPVGAGQWYVSCLQNKISRLELTKIWIHFYDTANRFKSEHSILYNWNTHAALSEISWCRKE